MTPHLRTSILRSALLIGILAGCVKPAPPAEAPPGDAPAEDPSASPAEATEAAEAPEATDARRPYDPGQGAPIIAGISYGPFREGQAPGGPNPSEAELLEDLQLVAARWPVIRVYSSRPPTEDIVRLIAEEELPLRIVIGAWIAPDAPEDNAAEVAAAVRLAQTYPEQVAAVSVGNETQVFWSGHRSPPETLIAAIREVRSQVTQPVTTADDYNFWNKPESHAVAEEVDFMLLHAYAMWNGQTLDDAVRWTADTIHSIRAEHPTLPIVIGETGWATGLNPEGDEVQYIKAPAGEAEQARFYAEFSAWAEEAGQPYFWFEAFDEPWKGSDDPREVEKHWGLYGVDRAPKAALRDAPEAAP